MRGRSSGHGGTVQKFAGDAVMAVFGIPQVHEDDALRAVRAAAEIRGSGSRRSPSEVGVELRFRTGINTGLVLSDEGRTLALGDPVNVAARLEQAARPGEILLGDETLRLVRDAVEVEALEPLSVKGKSEPLRAFRLLSVDPHGPGPGPALDVGLVGRERDLGLLREAWERVVAASRLPPAHAGGAGGRGEVPAGRRSCWPRCGSRATILSGRCLPYGEGITFWPLIEAMAGRRRGGRAGSRPPRRRRHRDPRGTVHGRCGGCSSRWPAAVP